METLTCIALARELDPLLKGAQIVLAEHADAGDTLLIQLLTKRAKESAAESGWLTMSSCMGEAVMFFHREKPPLIERAWPSPLSEHVERMYVRSISQNGMDRVVTIGMSKSPRGEDGRSLHVELFSPRLRAYLAAETGEVIEAHAARGGSAGRSVRGLHYSPPAAGKEELDPLTSSAEAIRDALPRFPGEDDLAGHLAGVGRTLAREVLARSKAGSREPAEVLKEMLGRAREGDAEGFVIAPSPAAPGGAAAAGRRATPRAAGGVRSAGRPGGPDAGAPAKIDARSAVALAFEPVSLPGVEISPCATVNDAVRRAFLRCRTLAADIDRRRAAAKEIRARLRRVAGNRLALVEELAQAGQAGEHRLKGELILAHMASVPRGAKEVDLPRPGSPREVLRVALDPSLAPAANAQAYFKRARKLERKLSFLPRRIDELKRKEAQLQTELEKTISGPAPSRGAAPAEPQRGRGPVRDKWPSGISPRRIVSSEGWTMYVGRSNQENDYVTFAFAKPDDIWFHAQGVAGSHVVLRREGRKAMPSRTCVAQAAAVAAYFSKGRTSNTVAVVYTEKKYVRKPRKGKPGTALYSHEKTIMVAPGLPPGVQKGAA